MSEVDLYRAVAQTRARTAEGASLTVAASEAARQFGVDAFTVATLARCALAACHRADSGLNSFKRRVNRRQDDEQIND